MTFLKMLIDAPLAGVIGWTLVHSLWEGAIISGALAAMLVAVRSPRCRYAAACLAMLVMLGAFSITFVHVMPEGTHRASPQRMPATQRWQSNPSQATTLERPGLAPLVPWLTPFWITGVSLVYLWRVADCVSVRRMRHCGVCSAPEHWQELVAHLGAQLRISRPVQLLESCLADVPIVLGHFRPLILMPVGLLSGMPPEQLQAILLHELAHISRNDYLVNVLQRLIEGLFFYHPAIWWVSRVLRIERENCCDDIAVHVSGDAYRYASALAALEEYRHSALQPAVAATGGNLMKRIRRLLYPTKPNGTWVPFLTVMVFITVTTASLAAWQAQPSPIGSAAVQERRGTVTRPLNAAAPLKALQPKPSQSAPPAAQQEEREAISPVYSKWLNEDVAYIIDAAERTAFLGLATDEDRDKFVERFWLNRDPAPGTPINKFKEEHYRRIAYANSHFASSKPGWQTDRGRMYIVYGRPDQVEAYPTGNAHNSNPFEIWSYKNTDIGNGGTVTFVDRTRDGNFQREQ